MMIDPNLATIEWRNHFGTRAFLASTMSQSLKRSFSRQSECGVEIPELPVLNGDLILDVFTHPSIKKSGPSFEPIYGDNTRLAALGQKALELAVTETLFKLKDPMLGVKDIAVGIIQSMSCYSTDTLSFWQSHRNVLLSDRTIRHWVDLYRLRNRVLCLPEARASLETPQVLQAFRTPFEHQLIMFWTRQLGSYSILM